MKGERSKRVLAIVCTAGIALILLIVFVVRYLNLKPVEQNESPNKLKAFYTTIIESGKSYFAGK